MTRDWSRLLFVATLAAATLRPQSARAQTPASAVAAEALFREGRELMATGQLVEACKKLESSEKLEPAVGTLFSLGECYEGQGRLATAWFAFREAATLSGRRDDKRGPVAQARADRLEPRLAHVVIRVPAGARAVDVSLDGDPLSAEVLGTRLPVDPGPHRVDARSTVTWSQEFTVEQEGALTVVDVPRPPAPPTLHEPVARRATGLALAAGGTAMVVAGGVLGMQAIVKGRDANRECTSGLACADAWAVHQNDSAKTYADVSTALVPIGLCLGAVGGYLLLTSHATLEPAVMPGAARLDVMLAW